MLLLCREQSGIFQAPGHKRAQVLPGSSYCMTPPLRQLQEAMQLAQLSRNMLASISTAHLPTLH